MSKPANKWQIGDFCQFEQIGRGKFGVVYKAVQESTNQTVAIKFVPKVHLMNANMAIQVRRQIEVQYRLRHTNICQLQGWFQDQENVYIVLEYCKQGSLFRTFKRQLSDSEVIQYMRELASAVAYMNQRSVIHRDIKLENILVTDKGLKLTDFGWCIHSLVQERLTYCGTIDYLSPQVVKKQTHNSSVDVYSLGILFYQLFFDTSPYYADTQECLLDNILLGELVFDDRYRKIPDEAKDLITNMLNTDKRARFTAKDVLNHKFLQNVKTESAQESKDV